MKAKLPFIERCAALIIVTLALTACAAGMPNDFVYDDVPIISENSRIHALSAWWEIVSTPYWPQPFVEQLHRPLTSLLLSVQWALGGGSALPFRLVSMALYAAGAAAVLSLGRRVLSARTAIACAAVFAVHPVHVEAVAQAVNQAELIVGIAAILMVAFYMDARQRGELRLRDWGGIGVLYATAIFAKEGGYVLPLLLPAAEILLIRNSPRLKVLSQVRGAAILGGVALAALAARAASLAGTTISATPFESLRGLDLGDRMLTVLPVPVQWLRLLAFPMRLQADFTAKDFPPVHAFGGAQLAGIVVIVGAAVLAWYMRRRAPVVAFGIIWCFVTLLPVSNIVPTGIILAERTLYVPSVGFVLAVAGLASYVTERLAAEQRSRAREWLAWACVVIVAVGLTKSANRLSLWNSAHMKVVPVRTPTEPLKQ